MAGGGGGGGFVEHSVTLEMESTSRELLMATAE